MDAGNLASLGVPPGNRVIGIWISAGISGTKV